MIEVGAVGADEREAFVHAFATAFSNVFKPDITARLTALVDDPVYRAVAARSGDAIVGTALDMPLELTVRPGVTVPCRGITWVGVLPTHRGRGVMRALLDDHVEACRRDGAAASLLHASQSDLYRGYGAATRRARVTVDTTHVRFRDAAPELEVRLVDPADALAACQDVWERCRLARPGFTTRPDPELRWALDEVATEGFCVFAGDDGYALYRVDRDWPGAHGEYKVRLQHLHAATPAAYAALWRYLCGLTHVVEVRADSRPIDEPLQHLVTQPRRVDVSHANDGLWLRPLDRPALCAARGLPDPGVDDEAFASLLLGAFTPASLAEGGRIGPDEAADWVSPAVPWAALEF